MDRTYDRGSSGRQDLCGKVLSLKEYGAFVEIIPVMMAWYIFLNWPTDTLGKFRRCSTGRTGNFDKSNWNR